MANRKPPDKKRQAELMRTAERRKSGYLATWKENPEFRAALHANDEEVLRRNKKLAYA